MKTNVLRLLSFGLVAAFAGSLSAAAITVAEFDKDNNRYNQKTVYADVVSWSHDGGVTYTLPDDPEKQLVAKRDTLISANLTEAVDFEACPALEVAYETNNVVDYRKVLVNGKATPVHKEFAQWSIARLSGGSGNALINAMKGYLKAYPKGNYARTAHMAIVNASGGKAKASAIQALIALGDQGSKAWGNLELGNYKRFGKDLKGAKTAYSAALAASNKAFFPSVKVQALSFLGQISSGDEAKGHFDACIKVKSRQWIDSMGRDKARGNAFLGRGRILVADAKQAEAYKDFISASFWLGTYGAVEGDCIFAAYQVALKLSADGDKKWVNRRDTLKEVLEESFKNLLKK